MNILESFFRSEDGAAAIEYGLIAGLISLVIVAALTTTGTNLVAAYEIIGARITAAFAG